VFRNKDAISAKRPMKYSDLDNRGFNHDSFPKKLEERNNGIIVDHEEGI
jgi:hypothetical protein